MREAIFNTEVVRSLRSEGHWAYKIPDFPQSMISGSRFNPEKPFDIVSFVLNKGVAIEGKQFKKYEAFGKRHMRPSQIAEFDQIVDTGSGRAFVFLNIRQAKPRLNRLIIFEWRLWRGRLGEGSIMKKDLEAMPYKVGAGGRYDLTGFIKAIGSDTDFWGE